MRCAARCWPIECISGPDTHCSSSSGMFCFWPCQHCVIVRAPTHVYVSSAEHRSALLCADLEPKRKAYLMQNIMASRYIVAQQKRLHTSPSRAADTAGLHQSHHPGGALGCAHYKRRSARLCSSCICIMRGRFVSRLFKISTEWHPATQWSCQAMSRPGWRPCAGASWWACSAVSHCSLAMQHGLYLLRLLALCSLTCARERTWVSR